ncbi:hypothetical protein PH5382_01881 [Phaeobacter sp. CECT 5382]|nr:hypothetical protein PH5382_01881 [Phaeobacter sp. CECT 5382]
MPPYLKTNSPGLASLGLALMTVTACLLHGHPVTWIYPPTQPPLWSWKLGNFSRRQGELNRSPTPRGHTGTASANDINLIRPAGTFDPTGVFCRAAPEIPQISTRCRNNFENLGIYRIDSDSRFGGESLSRNRLQTTCCQTKHDQMSFHGVYVPYLTQIYASRQRVPRAGGTQPQKLYPPADRSPSGHRLCISQRARTTFIN